MTARTGSGIGFDPQIDFGDLAARHDRLRLALGDHAAEIDDHQPVDDGEQRMDDMLDPDDRDAGLAERR